MKTILAVLAFGLAGCAVSALAQPRANTWYGKADAGGSWVQDSKVTELFGPVTGDNKVKFDPGARFGLGMGYNVTDWFAAEAELGMSWNHVKQMATASPMEANLFNAPFLVNAKLQLPTSCVVRPYVGVGAGGASSTLDIDHLSYGTAELSGSASDVVFAWQGFAGVMFDLNERMSLGLEYRYVWTAAPQYDIDWGWYYHISSDHLKLDDLQTHSVSLVFAYQF